MEQAGRVKAVPCGVTPKQHNLDVQTSQQVLMNPEGDLIIFVWEGAGEWCIWGWTSHLLLIHLPLKLKNENEQPGKSFIWLSGDHVTKPDGSHLTFFSRKTSICWQKFIVSSLLRIYWMLRCSWGMYGERQYSFFVNVTFSIWIFFSQLYFACMRQMCTALQRTKSQWRINKDCPAWWGILSCVII